MNEIGIGSRVNAPGITSGLVVAASGRRMVRVQSAGFSGWFERTECTRALPTYNRATEDQIIRRAAQLMRAGH